MKILLIYKNANNQKITDISKPMQGGAEKFCKSIFDHFDNVDVYQVNQLDDHELDIKEKQKISFLDHQLMLMNLMLKTQMLTTLSIFIQMDLK